MSTGTGSTDERTDARGTDVDAADASTQTSPAEADTTRVDGADAVTESSADVADSPADDSVADSAADATEPADTATDSPADADETEVTGASALREDTADAEDLDDEYDAETESDASEADEDEPAETVPVTAATAGPLTDAGAPHRRRRSDPPPAVYNYAEGERQHRDDHRRRSRRGAGWVAASIVLFLLLGVSVALNWHLWHTTEAWEARADELTAINYDLGSQLSNEQATTMQLESEIDLVSQQLATSNQRVIELSAESASAIDESAFADQQIELLTGHLTTATSTATSLQRCVDGQQQLAEYLHTPDEYDPDELADFEDSVNDLCATAERNQQRLLAELAE